MRHPIAASKGGEGGPALGHDRRRDAGVGKTCLLAEFLAGVGDDVTVTPEGTLGGAPPKSLSRDEAVTG